MKVGELAAENHNIIIFDGDVTNEIKDYIAKLDPSKTSISLDLETEWRDGIGESAQYYSDVKVAIGTFYINAGYEREDVYVVKMHKSEDKCRVLSDMLSAYEGTTYIHNSEFDFSILAAQYGIELQRPFCTRAYAKALYSIRGDDQPSVSLHKLLKRFRFPPKGDRKITRSDWFAEDLTDEQYEYLLGDVISLPGLAQILIGGVAREIGKDEEKAMREDFIDLIRSHGNMYSCGKFKFAPVSTFISY